MAIPQPVFDSLESIRTTPLYEWTFAVIVANLAVQFYRCVAQLVTFIFDLLKLRHGVDLFWPLTTDELKPFTRYIVSDNELLYKLIENFILTALGVYWVYSLMENYIVGIIISVSVYTVHGLMLLIGLIFIQDHMVPLLSLEFIIWAATTGVELTAVALTIFYLSYYGSLVGFQFNKV